MGARLTIAPDSRVTTAVVQGKVLSQCKSTADRNSSGMKLGIEKRVESLSRRINSMKYFIKMLLDCGCTATRSPAELLLVFDDKYAAPCRDKAVLP
jgi:hypothetical protein